MGNAEPQHTVVAETELRRRLEQLRRVKALHAATTSVIAMRWWGHPPCAGRS